MNKYKPYLCISCSHTSGVERWLKTFKSSGVAEQVRLLVFMWKPYFDEQIAAILPDDTDYTVYHQDSKYIGNKMARKPLLDLITKPFTHVFDNEWFLWTDCHDVIFQDQLPEFWINSDKALICPEHLKHKESDYWLPIIASSPEFAYLHNKLVYNSGCFAMKGVQILDYFTELNQPSYSGRYGKSGYDGDQLIYNKWVHKNISSCVADIGIFLSLYAGYVGKQWTGRSEHSKLVNGKFITPEGKPFSIVHASGHTKNVLDAVYPNSNNESTREYGSVVN